MSWTHNQQQKPNQTTNQSSSTTFNQIQNWQAQDIKYLPTTTQSTSQNIWSNTQQAASLRNTQNNWEQPANSCAQFFVKPEPDEDNFIQPNPKENLQHQNDIRQSQYSYSLNQNVSKLQHNMNLKSTKPETMPQSDGWGDWDWNDNNFNNNNNNNTNNNNNNQEAFNRQNYNQKTIESSFKTEPNDNWNWGEQQTARVDNLMNAQIIKKEESVYNQNPRVSQTPDSNDILELKENSVYTTSDLISNTPPHLAFNEPQNLDGNIKSINNLQLFTSSPNIASNYYSSDQTSDNTQSLAANAVYVSQAKPVAQPARQYALSPSTGQITPPNSTNSQTPEESCMLPPPPNTPPQQNLPSNLQQSMMTMPPPPPLAQTSMNLLLNPFKRSGVAQHHRSQALSSNQQQVSFMPANNYSARLDTLQHNITGNQEYLTPENSEIIADKNFEVENQEIAPNNDRNQYLQTGHLSNDGYNDAVISNTNEQNNEPDNFPPPGLSRLVLGQPENDISLNINQSEIPPGFDRMIPGTDETSLNNLERQADGQDTVSISRSTFNTTQNIEQIDSLLNIDITADRNLYFVPGESDAHEQQRVVTGLENGTSQGAEQRDVDLDGENLEDQQHQNHRNHFHINDDDIFRDEPIEGANTLDGLVNLGHNVETESSITVDTANIRESTASTCNDDSDQRSRQHTSYMKNSNGRREDDRRRRHNEEKKEKRGGQYDSEDTDYSSNTERKKLRDISSKTRKQKDRDEKDRRNKKDTSLKDHERYREEKDKENRRYEDRYLKKYEKSRDTESSRFNSRYESETKFETDKYERHRTDNKTKDRSEYEYRCEEKSRRHHRDKNERDERDRNKERIIKGDDNDYRDDRNRYRRRDRGHRDRYRNEYEDEYRRGGSRNARESDREKERTKEKGNRLNSYGYRTNYGYDPYVYFQQQYYEQLRMTNPQAYAEIYRKYYEKIQNDSLLTDGRNSVNSGRSSTNNEKERYNYEPAQQYIQQTNDYQRQFITSAMSNALNSTTISEQNYNFNDGTRVINCPKQSTENISFQQSNFSQTTASMPYCVQNKYTDKRSKTLVQHTVDGSPLSQKEQTWQAPAKFSNNHSTISLSNGLLVCSKSKLALNGTGNIVKIMKYSVNDITRRLFQNYPGPLIRGVTHKRTIIEFCEEQIRLGPSIFGIKSRENSNTSINSSGHNNRASFTLMWDLLIFLIRQNGIVVGADIAELLMKNRERYPYEFVQESSKSSSTSVDNLTNSEPKTLLRPNNDINIDKSNEKEQTKFNDFDGKSNFSNDEITEKFRNLLLYGDIEGALEWATENNLWGHALFLASKVDARFHANIMIKFANKLRLNDPLQTLYQLMSGKIPSSVTFIQDEKWGDWRLHLAMILSNTSLKPELNRRATTTLGDTLYNRGDLFGAQFCYLMAQNGFSKYPFFNNDSNLMSNSPNAVRLVLLGSSHHKTFKEFTTNEAIMMTEIYEYACSLYDDKFSIAEFQPYKYLLATRMLDYDLNLKTLSYMQQIYQHIQLNPAKYEINFIEKVHNLADKLKFYDPIHEKTLDDQQNIGDAMKWTNQGPTNIHIEDPLWLQSLRNVLNEYVAFNYQNNLNNSSQNYENEHIETAQQNIDQQFREINQQFNELNMQYNNIDGISQQNQQIDSIDNEQKNYENSTNKLIINNIQQDTGDNYRQPLPNVMINSTITSMEHSNSIPSYNQSYGDFLPPQQNFEHQQQQSEVQQQYWEKSHHNENQTPKISLPYSNTKNSSFYGDQKKENDNNNDASKILSKSETNVTSNPKQTSKSSNIVQQNSGWFGGIWNKLSLKPKNQMILPDDKNPTIVWDPEKKKWVNKDPSTSNESENFKPPPKMIDLQPNTNIQKNLNTQPPSQEIYPPVNTPQPNTLTNSNMSYSDNIGTIDSSTVASNVPNKYKIQRSRNLKNSYVDVFNPSNTAQPSPGEQILAPTQPAPQAGFFLPNSAVDLQKPFIPEGVPQLYDPNQFSGYQN